MPDRRITLCDIATACGLSRATVPLVLRDGPLVRADTRVRVQAELARQGLRLPPRCGRSAPVRLERGGAGGQQPRHPFFAEFVAGVDFALVGFDDIPEAAVSPPPLTTIAVAPRERGIAVARLVFARLRGEASSRPRTVIAPAELRVRASSRVAFALEQIPRGAAA